MNIIIGDVLCDWLTLTTYKTGLHKRIQKIVDGAAGTLRDTNGKRYSRYVGNVYEHGFSGTGEQSGQTHFMSVVSGAGADWALSDFILAVGQDRYNVTRIDLQVTIQVGEWYKARDIKDKVEKVGRFKPLLYEGSDGLDTCYIGSRNSTRFARLYVKSEGVLRFEMQYSNQGKNRAASAVFQRLVTARKVDHSHRPEMRRILSHEIQRRIPDARLRDAFLEKVGRESSRVVIQTTELDTKREWISNAVKKGVLGYGVLSHDNYQFVREILAEMIDLLDRAMR